MYSPHRIRFPKIVQASLAAVSSIRYLLHAAVNQARLPVSHLLILAGKVNTASRGGA